LREKLLPFELLVPNATTIESMKEARGGELKSFTSVKGLECGRLNVRTRFGEITSLKPKDHIARHLKVICPLWSKPWRTNSHWTHSTAIMPLPAIGKTAGIATSSQTWC